MLQGYKSWQSFVYKGKKFLALDNCNNIHIYGEGFANYGSYMSIESFKKYYDRDGEALKLS